MTDRFRTGRKVGRTIYRLIGDDPNGEEELIGLMDTRELAAFAVEAMNRADREHQDAELPLNEAR
jgi:hypothetical protein